MSTLNRVYHNIARALTFHKRKISVEEFNQAVCQDIYETWMQVGADLKAGVEIAKKEIEAYGQR